MPPVTPSRILRGCGLMAGLWGGLRAHQTTAPHAVFRSAWVRRASAAFRRKQPANRRPIARRARAQSEPVTHETADVDTQLAGARATAGEAARTRPRRPHRGELLAILLRTGVRGQSALDVARALLLEFGSLSGLLTTARERSMRGARPGPARYVILQASLELARRHYQEPLRAGVTLRHAARDARIPPDAAAGPVLRGLLLPVAR